MTLTGIFILSFLCPWAIAQGSVSSQSTLTEEDAVSSAIKNNYELKQAMISVEFAKIDLQKAGLWPNPEGEFSFHNDKFYANEGEGGYEYGLNQAVPISGRIIFQKRTAKLGIERAEWQLKDIKRQVIALVRKTYYEVSTLEQKEEILNILVKTNQDFLKSVKARLAQAEVSSVDISLARGEILLLNQELAEVKAHIYETRSTLNQLMGQDLNAPFTIVPQALIFPSIDLKTVTQNSLENRSDLKAKEIEEKMGSAALSLAKAMQIPDITIGGFFQKDKSRIDVNNQPIRSSSRFLGFKILIPLPFFNHNQGEIARSKVENESVGIQYEALYKQITKEAGQAYIRLTTSKEILDSYENGMMEEVKKSLKLIQNAYLQGQVNIFDVVQTQGKVYTIEKSYLEASQSAREAIIDLDSVMGMDFQNEKKEITHEK